MTSSPLFASRRYTPSTSKTRRLDPDGGNE
jgi:hypothetical protein